MECSFCEGKGTEPCSNCYGTGLLGDEEEGYEQEECERCEGFGTQACEVCDGSGYVVPGPEDYGFDTLEDYEDNMY
jgi:DnaJ-class molecular chaperone